MAGSLDVLTDPASFFDREVASPRFGRPVAIVALLGVLPALTAGLVVYRLFGDVDGGAGLGLIVFLVALVFFVVAAFAIWLLFAAAFYAVSAVMGGEGSFRELFLLVGWGFLPRLFGAVVQFAVGVVTVSRIRPLPAVPEDPELLVDELSRSMAGVAAGPLATLADLLGVAFLLWSAYIWIEAVRRSRSLDRRDATVAVGVPVLVALLLRLPGIL